MLSRFFETQFPGVFSVETLNTVISEAHNSILEVSHINSIVLCTKDT